MARGEDHIRGQKRAQVFCTGRVRSILARVNRMKRVSVLLLVTALWSCAAVRTTLAQAGPQDLRKDDMPALLRAAASGDLDEARRLLQSGADVNQPLDGIGLTALMFAAQRGDVEMVKLFLKAGANPNAAGGIAHVGFFTPLKMAMNPKNKNRL